MKKTLILFTMIMMSFTISHAQSKVVPIVDIKVNGLLGGVQNGKFLNAGTTAGKLRAEQKYTLYFLNAPSQSLIFKKPVNSSEMDLCPDFYGISGYFEEYQGGLSEEEDERQERRHKEKFDKGGVGLGDGFDWNPQPRAIKAVDLNNAEYLKIVGDFLLTKRIAKHKVELKQAIRIDLDGDGADEVLLVASRFFNYELKDGKKTFDEYSVVLLRKVIGGKPQTILIAGEFYPKNTSDYDGNFFELSSVLDLNGDGKMELVVYSEYYEGNQTEVFELIGNKPVAVKTLTAGCGV